MAIEETAGLSSTSPGDCEARAALVERLFKDHNEALLRFLALRLGSQQEAKEVAQEAYVKLLSLEQSETIGFLRSFLFTIAGNLAIDRLRTRQRRAFSSTLFDQFHSDLPSPEQQAEGQEELRIVQQLISQLPPKCRRAFLLQRINGLSTATIAAQMDVPERTVRRYILRAVVFCREGLDRATIGKERIHGHDRNPPRA